MTLVKYGSAAFDPKQFKPVTRHNYLQCKPDGGMWACPVDSEYGWKHWCEGERFSADLDVSFTFTYEGRYIVIDKLADLDDLTWTIPEELKGLHGFCGCEYIDFANSLAKGIDAVHLTVEGQNRTRHTFPRNLYGWDCESVLILNPNKVIQIPDDVAPTRRLPTRRFNFTQ